MTIVHVTLRNGELRTVEGTAGTSLMEAIRNEGIDELLAICGGCCSCATCHVWVESSQNLRMPAMSRDEDDLLDTSSHRTAASRLSCQIVLDPAVSGLRVTIAPED